jgi:peroxiredoxin
MSPEDAEGILPLLPEDGRYQNTVVQAYMQQGRIDDAIRLSKDQLKRGSVIFRSLPALLERLAADQPDKAIDLYRESLNAFAFERASEEDAWWLLQCLPAMAPYDKAATAEAARKLLDLALSARWENEDTSIFAKYPVGEKGITTLNSTLTIKLGSALCLRALDPDAYVKRSPLLGDAGRTIESISAADAMKAARPTAHQLVRLRYDAHTADEKQIKSTLAQLRKPIEPKERARLAISLATQIRDLPADSFKLTLAQTLGHLSTEGELAQEALQTVADTLALAIGEQHPKLIAERMPWTYGEDYLQLANMVRYEHLKLPDGAPSLAATMALLRLRELLQAKLDFALPDMEGKTHTLSSLRGEVVLVSFGATWCPPCVVQWSNLEKLYKRYSKKGLVILMISNEPLEALQVFMKSHHYSFPFLRDAAGMAARTCGFEGIPRTLVFNRDGTLASQAIDMRTEKQLEAMLKATDLE